jgi:hypothetical protein
VRDGRDDKDGLTQALLEFAKDNKREDFNWLAASQGWGPNRTEEVWRGTRHRLGYPGGVS